MYRIGIDLGGTKIDSILMDEGGTVMNATRCPTPKDYMGLIKTIKTIVEELDSVVDERCPVGMGTPGAWVAANNAMKNCNANAFNGKPLLTDLQRVLNRPVRIANDADCMAVSEATDGAAAGASNVFAAILGTGVGSGVVLNGQLVQGPNGLAGEWGHNSFPQVANQAKSRLKVDLDDENRTCYCGRTNCVETFLSGRGLEATYASMHGTHLPSKEIGSAATEKSQETIEEYTLHLALALSVIVNILDPEVIVLAGGLSEIDSVYPKLPGLLKEFAFSSEGLTRIERAVHGAASGRRGAAWLFEASAGGK